MDTLDRKILSALQANARASLQEIGAAVGLSASPCWARIKKLEEAGVIEGYTVRLNPLALGLGDTVLVQVALDSDSDNTLEKFGERLLICLPHVKGEAFEKQTRLLEQGTKAAAGTSAVAAAPLDPTPTPTPVPAPARSAPAVPVDPNNLFA